MDEEKKAVLYDLSEVLMANERREAEAVEGYQQQLKLIWAARESLGGLEEYADYAEFLDNLEAATKEKISDELNHGQSLYGEYVQFTGIKPAED